MKLEEPLSLREPLGDGDARGDVLYMTHHFTLDELTGLLEAAGFAEIRMTAEQETSSRRPDEAASFLYATCRSGP